MKSRGFLKMYFPCLIGFFIGTFVPLFLYSIHSAFRLRSIFSDGISFAINEDSKVIQEDLSLYKTSIHELMHSMSNFKTAIPKCQDLHPRRSGDLKSAKSWQFNEKEYREAMFLEANYRCDWIKHKLAFFDVPLSTEEQNFPLAYGMLVYKNSFQSLSSISIIKLKPMNGNGRHLRFFGKFYIFMSLLVIALFCMALYYYHFDHREAFSEKWTAFTVLWRKMETANKWQNYKFGILQLILSIPDFKHAVPVCKQLTIMNNKSVILAKLWNFDVSTLEKSFFLSSSFSCDWIKDKLAFFDSPLSVEEKNFPLAYAMLVYKDSFQVYMLLSAIYQPQNSYCIAVDSQSSDEFKKQIGVDLPLKTNLEMVRILKHLNGTLNMEVTKFNPQLLTPESPVKPPLDLWKSSLSSVLSREAVNGMFTSNKVQELIAFLSTTRCPDESLWATIFGNNNVLPLPGSFNASEVYAHIAIERAHLERSWNKDNKYFNYTIYGNDQRDLAEPFELFRYYISRYQIWESEPNIKCHGKFTSSSCVYGIGDLPNLLARPELIAHKFYLDIEPAAYFCVYETVRLRALDSISQSAFRGLNYRQLPQVRMAAGEKLKNVKYFFTPWKIDNE